jgi:uncharacterized cupin superfamily protein
MSFLQIIDTDPQALSESAAPLPERLISGGPSFRTW